MNYNELTAVRDKLQTAAEGIYVRISKLPYPNQDFVRVFMHEPMSNCGIVDSVEIDGQCWKIEGFVEREPYKSATSLFAVSKPALEDVRVYLTAKPKPNMEFTINLGRYAITSRERIGDYLFKATVGKMDKES